MRTMYEYKGRKNLTAVQLMFVIRKDMEFAMPPRGVTRHKTTSAGKKYERITWRCEVEGCWYVCLARDDEHLAQQQALHKQGFMGDSCPSAPRRESLPSGLPEIEKLWRELDDITDALVAKEQYRGMAGDELKSYAKGIGFCIVMKDRTYFPDIASVSKEAAERWKMRNDKLEYRKTPTSCDTNGSWVVAGGWKEQEHGSVERVKPQQTPAKEKAKHNLNDSQVKAIKTAMQSGMFTARDLAETYGIPVAVVEEVANK